MRRPLSSSHSPWRSPRCARQTSPDPASSSRARDPRHRLRPTARAPGAAEIIVSDLVAERRERALGYGATRVIDPREVDIATAGLDVNAFVDASGAPAAVMSGVKAVRPAGRAVLVGLGSSEMPLPVEQVQNLEITVTGIFRYTDTWPTAIHLVASGLVELDSLVTGKFDLDHAADALESDLDPDSLKAVVYPA